MKASTIKIQDIKIGSRIKSLYGTMLITGEKKDHFDCSIELKGKTIPGAILLKSTIENPHYNKNMSLLA